MIHLSRRAAPAFAARLQRIIERRRAQAKLSGLALPLTFRQKTASHRRLSRTCVAQAQHFVTVQENNHARLL